MKNINSNINNNNSSNHFCCDLDGICLLPGQRGPPVLGYDEEEAESVELKLNNDEEALQRARERRAKEKRMAEQDASSKRSKKKHSAKKMFPRIGRSLSNSFQRNDKSNSNSSNRSKSSGSKRTKQATGGSKSSKSTATSKKAKMKKDTSLVVPDSTKNNKQDDATDMVESDVEENRIRAHVIMMSGCDDAQTSADVQNVSNFALPITTNGNKAGGACTSALLKVLYNRDERTFNHGLSFVQILTRMRTMLQQDNYTQIPQLSSSRPVDLRHDFYIVPPDCLGTRRAILIGINYIGQSSGELLGCHNDCLNMKKYIMKVWGFQEENITLLLDDGVHLAPTKENILSVFQQIAYTSQPGDAVFCHYSGHGARIRDDDWGEEKDGYDEALVPLDYQTAGLIRDDDLYTNLVCALPRGVTLVALVDACHSGSLLDLPYKYKSHGQNNNGRMQELLFEETKTEWVLCNDPLLPFIFFFMVVVFCAIFFPMMLVS